MIIMILINKNTIKNNFYNYKNNFIKITKQHCNLLTNDFCKTNVPLCNKSRWVGYSCFLYITPVFFVPGRCFFSYILRLLYLLQAPVAFASDYIWHGHAHISHGIDRWFASFLVLITIFLCTSYLSLLSTFYYGIIPLSSLYKSKKACFIKDSNLYNIYQTIWHITSPISCCLLYCNIHNLGKTI